jgi:hypothetical protein
MEEKEGQDKVKQEINEIKEEGEEAKKIRRNDD